MQWTCDFSVQCSRPTVQADSFVLIMHTDALNRDFSLVGSNSGSGEESDCGNRRSSGASSSSGHSCSSLLMLLLLLPLYLCLLLLFPLFFLLLPPPPPPLSLSLSLSLPLSPPLSPFSFFLLLLLVYRFLLRPDAV